MPHLIKKFGRTPKPDPRDQNYLIKDHFNLAGPAGLTSRYWNPDGWWGNQGSTPFCVGYAWAHWIEDGPVEHAGVAPIKPPLAIYEGAQTLDEWPGENYAGTSVRGGVKYLVAQKFVQSYYWAFDTTTMAQYILNYGPMVIGTNWYNWMFYPDRNGLLKVGGGVAGGHAYVVNGVDTKAQRFRIKNSWGKSWGKGGMAYITFRDMGRLISQRGEACIAVEATDSQINS